MHHWPSVNIRFVSKGDAERTSRDVRFVSLDVAARHHLRRNFWMTALYRWMSQRDITCDAISG
jgi:hypothetical protein